LEAAVVDDLFEGECFGFGLVSLLDFSSFPNSLTSLRLVSHSGDYEAVLFLEPDQYNDFPTKACVKFLFFAQIRLLFLLPQQNQALYPFHSPLFPNSIKSAATITFSFWWYGFFLLLGAGGCVFLPLFFLISLINNAKNRGPVMP